MNQPSERVAEFRRLHQAGCFVIPNPWDPGSARLLQHCGFRALASTSAGLAWSLGARDNTLSVEDVLAHLADLAGAVTIPVNADFEGGFAESPNGVAANVTRATQTGIAGLSIEDSTGDESHPLYDFSLAVERVRAAKEAIDRSGTGILLTGRSEGFICGRPDLDETIRRLVAYAEAGAECLYAPGIKDLTHIDAVVKAVAPKAVNVLVSTPFTTVAELAALGVRRVSVGGALARTAWTGAVAAAREIAELGTFSRFGETVSGSTIESHFGVA